MKKYFVALSLFLAIIGIVTPATSRADSFSFSVSDSPRRHHDYPQRYDWDNHYGPRRWHRRPVIHMAPPVVYAPPARTIIYAPSTYAPSNFVAPVYGVSPSVIADQASPTYHNEYGQLCREYQTSGYVAGSGGQLYGTACLQPDGSWRVVN